MFGRDIRERLLNDGVCDRGNLLALLTVNKGIKNKLRMSLFLISTNIELSISNLKLLSWNLRSFNVIFATPLKVVRLLEDSDDVFSHVFNGYV